ncbi:MAG: TetR/AcrR family transcriptional regulator [bacterium]|nr:TetR/AcrR family transcriptional regulator [bacterium]MCP5069876.1 TetR/AcrR family transcriptional regulator [bacterium]
MPAQAIRKLAYRPRDAGRTRVAILAAATTQFAAHGLGGARVDEIARGAGVNKALLYHYFGSKQALFLAVLEGAYANIRGAEAALALEAVDPPEAMERLVDFTWDYFLEHPEFITLLNSENLHRARHLKRSKQVRVLHHPLVDRIGEILERGVARGDFRADVDPVQLYISIAALGYFYLSNAHTLGTVFDRDLLTEREKEARHRHVQEVVRGYLRPEAIA